MKKILFWYSAEFTHFCLTHFLQKKLDAECFAMIDCPSTHKRFYEEQSLVKLEKKWYIHDHIKNDFKINQKYLRDIEKKYQISIWDLLLNERIFYRFFKFMKFSAEEILSIEEQIIRLFESVLDEIKPDYLITKLPHLHHHELLTRICEKRNIEILMLNFSLVGPGTILMQKISEYDEIGNYNNTEFRNMTFDECYDFLKGTKENMLGSTITLEKNKEKISPMLLDILFRYLFSNNDKIHTNFDYYGRTKRKVVSYEIKQSLKKSIRRRFINKEFQMNPNLDIPFVYMPLSVDMERAVLIDAPYYTNHVELVRSVAKSIPIDSVLYVKEHPAQNMRSWRPIKEYKEMMDIPNVVLIHPNYSTNDLYQNCNLVVTIGGTSGFEAAVYKKPSVVLSHVRYDFLPSVEFCESINDLHHVINRSLEKTVNYEDVSKYIHFVKSITSDFNWGKFNKEFHDEFYSHNNVDVEISEIKLEQFLEKQKNELKLLTELHIKKLNK